MTLVAQSSNRKTSICWHR